MYRFATVFVVFLASVVPAWADDAPTGLAGLVVADAGEAALERHKWVSRPLVVFADAPADPRLREQLALLEADVDALAERDVVVIIDTDPGVASPARIELRPRGFMIALLAKDGSVVFRKPLPWDVREISRSIDKLPLRKQEMARARAGSG